MSIEQRGKPFRENWLQIDTLRCGMDWSEEDLGDLKREGFFERTEGWLRNYKINRSPLYQF